MFALSKKTIKIFALILVFSVVAACGTSEEKREPAPDFQLQNFNGEQLSLADTNGKARLIYFYFSSCTDVCLPTTQLLSKVQEQLKEEGVFGTETAILSITFDPVRDTPERLKEFSGFYNADPSGWYFLRGEEQYSRDLALEYGVNVIDVGDGQFGHQNVITLVDPEGNYVKYYNANDIELEAKDIVEDMLDLL